jgi:subtilase family protein
VGRKNRAVLAAALLVTGLAVVPAAAQEKPAAASPLGMVTLITGDQVVVQGERVAGVQMAPGRERVRYWQYQLNGHEYVVPEDAARLLRDDRMDQRLFDITGLLEQDYDDAHEPTVPTIVTSGLGTFAASSALTVVDTPKPEAARRWRERAVGALAAEKVWLNGRVRPSLDQSVPQIGAPAAWQAGFRGDGVKVAVLDTGIDADHPDLKAAIDVAADFTGEGVQDVVGHGTHVASTIAGTGAASQGRFTGVAPGARLLVGKVLAEDGGREDWIIAGMRWAVANGAKVVNMSLGGAVTDGTDLMSQTVNELSASSGALFVIAAGNSGARQTIGSPGAADRALTVANVTKADKLSTSSSQGPRLGDLGLKPEIAAPGTDIVAARAAGTLTSDSVDEDYTRLSGTSMASPHVAGAAAIVAQRHPDWTGEQIKSSLIGSSTRLGGVDTLAQGAGRVDVGRAVAQDVRVEGLAGFGKIVGKRDVTREITYVNDGATPVTLALDVDVNHRDLVTAQASVVVPAKGSAKVVLTAHGSEEPRGEVSGVLLAKARGVALSTPVLAGLVGVEHRLTVNVQPRQGDPEFALVIAQDERTGLAEVAFTDTGTAEFTVPTGRYRVLGRALDTTYSATMFAKSTDVRGDTAVTVDGKQAQRVTVGLDDPEARPQGGGGQVITSDVDEAGPLPGTGVSQGGGVPGDLYTVGEQARGLRFTAASYWAYPLARTTVAGAGGFEFRDPVAPWDMGVEGRLAGRLVDVGEADTESIDEAGDVAGAIAVLAPRDWSEPGYPPGEQMMAGIALLKARGAKAVISFFNPTVESPNGVIPALPTVLIFDAAELRRAQELMRERTVEATLDVRSHTPVAYFLADRVDGVPTGHDFRFRQASLGRIDRTLVDTMPKDTYRFHLASWSLSGVTAGAEVEARWPQRRTDLVSPGASFTMFGSAGFSDTGEFGGETTIPVAVTSGTRSTSRVFGAPFGPELTTPLTSRQDGKPVPWAYREGDRITLSVPMFADSGPGNASQFDTSNQGSTVLSKDGREIARRDDVPALGSFVVPRGDGRFRLVADAHRPASEFLSPALSPRTRAEWTFRANPGTDQRAALPLLDVRYDLPLDDHNTAASGKPLVGRVSAVHQPGARASRIREIQVEVSYDEGETWRLAKVSGTKLTIPAGQSAFASLRTTARDADGNSVVETVIRAYALR